MQLQFMVRNFSSHYLYKWLTWPVSGLWSFIDFIHGDGFAGHAGFSKLYSDLILFSWNVKVHCHFTRPSLVILVLNCTNPFSTIFHFIKDIHFPICIQSLRWSLHFMFFPTTFYMYFSSAPCIASIPPLPSSLIWWRTKFEDYKLWRSSLCSFLQSLVPVSVPTILSEIPNLLSSFNMRDKVLYPHKTSDKIIVV